MNINDLSQASIQENIPEKFRKIGYHKKLFPYHTILIFLWYLFTVNGEGTFFHMFVRPWNEGKHNFVHNSIPQRSYI